MYYDFQSSMFFIYKTLCGTNTAFSSIWITTSLLLTYRREKNIFFSCVQKHGYCEVRCRRAHIDPRFNSMVYYYELLFTHSGCCYALERHVKAYRPRGGIPNIPSFTLSVEPLFTLFQ